jgi:hypothetical protein
MQFFDGFVEVIVVLKVMPQRDHIKGLAGSEVFKRGFDELERRIGMFFPAIVREIDADAGCIQFCLHQLQEAGLTTTHIEDTEKFLFAFGDSCHHLHALPVQFPLTSCHKGTVSAPCRRSLVRQVVRGVVGLQFKFADGIGQKNRLACRANVEPIPFRIDRVHQGMGGDVMPMIDTFTHRATDCYRFIHSHFPVNRNSSEFIPTDT